jgi:hypothetical protein
MNFVWRRMGGIWDCHGRRRRRVTGKFNNQNPKSKETSTLNLQATNDAGG